MAAISGARLAGRPSTTKCPMSSNTFSAVLLPAPESPVTTQTRTGAEAGALVDVEAAAAATVLLITPSRGKAGSSTAAPISRLPLQGNPPYAAAWGRSNRAAPAKGLLRTEESPAQEALAPIIRDQSTHTRWRAYDKPH